MELYIFTSIVCGILIGSSINLANIIYFRRNQKLLGSSHEYKEGTEEYMKIESRIGSKFIIVTIGMIIASAVMLGFASTNYLKTHEHETLVMTIIVICVSVLLSYVIAMRLLTKPSRKKRSDWL